MRVLVWFRRDLRFQDNTALSHAARDCDDGLVALYLVTPGAWKEHDDASAKVGFWLENLRRLASRLAELQIPLRIETCETYQQVPQIVASVATDCHCQAVYFNREYEVNERERDRQVESHGRTIGSGCARLSRSRDYSAACHPDRRWPLLFGVYALSTCLGKKSDRSCRYTRPTWPTARIEHQVIRCA